MKTVVVVARLKDSYAPTVLSHLRGVYSKMYRLLEARACPTPVGYIYDPDDAGLVDMLRSYRDDWIRFGGNADGYAVYLYDVEADTAESFALFGQCVRRHCADRLDAIADAYEGRMEKYKGTNWLADVRTHKGARTAYEYVQRWYKLFPRSLGTALNALQDVREALIRMDTVASGVSIIRRVAAMLRNTDEEAVEG